MSIYATNPIMPGFYPDPSLCAVGEDFYLCNSTFSYFPGLPVMHSKDLVHWEQIGNIMDRHSQLVLAGGDHSAGLFAPTIRYNNGKFYCICTNTTYGDNYVVTADNPEGPWSEPTYIKDADGIDPSLFFDDDGKCYYIGTHPNPDGGAHYNGDWYIYISEIDTTTWQLVGEKHNVWNGALKRCIWPEGPHLYKLNGYYYIMHAEGGTGPEHSEMVCRSKTLFGPYENNPKNPILTHRHLGKDFPIKYVGHGDIVKTVNDEWFMVMLAVRPLNRFTTMGRETFLARVIWEDDWPVVNPGVGMLEDKVAINLPAWDPLKDSTSYTYRTHNKTTIPGTDKAYDFAAMKELGDEFLFLRNYPADMYSLTDNGLALKCRRETIKDVASPSYISIRQQHHYFTSEAVVDASKLGKSDTAGLVYLQSNTYNLRIEVSSDRASMVLCRDGKDEVLDSVTLNDTSSVSLKFVVDGLIAKTYANGELIGEASISDLSTEVAGGFVGCTIGIYASGNGTDGGEAVFKKFCYQAD